jgi:uncharacterized protein (DUF362 family)
MAFDRRNFIRRMAGGLLGAAAVGPGASAVSAWTGAATNSVLNQARGAAGGQLKITNVTPYIVRLQRDAKGQLSGVHCLLCRIVTDEATALVSAPVLKDHNLAGLSAGLKNFYGAIHNPNKYHDHGCDPFIADVCAHAHIRDRLRLVVCDAARPQYHLGPARRAQWQWAYGGILLGTDPVAVDRVGCEILERKRAAAGLKPLEADGRPVRYLASAEQRGLGAADLERIEVVSLGKPWQDVS